MNTNVAAVPIGKFQQIKYKPSKNNSYAKKDGIFLVNVKVVGGSTVSIKPHIITAHHKQYFTNMLAELNKPAKPAVNPVPNYHYIHQPVATQPTKKSFSWPALVFGVIAVIILLLWLGPLFNYISSVLSNL